MIISFIGMSGVGKSTWSLRLEEKEGFKRYSCDELIEKELEPELQKRGYEGTEGLSRWIGEPYEKHYAENSRRYLAYEAGSLKRVLDETEEPHADNIVIDTTGSVIYLPSDLLGDLKKRTTVVYLEAPASAIEEMTKRYLAFPKPVIWGDIYRPLPGEKQEETLKRCYPELLQSRVESYERLADITIGYDTQMKEGFSAHDLLSLISK